MNILAADEHGCVLISFKKNFASLRVSSRLKQKKEGK